MNELAYSIGFFLGDGTVGASVWQGKTMLRVRWFTDDREPLDRIADELEKVFGRRYAVAVDKSKHVKVPYHRLQATCREIYDFFLSNTEARNRVPPELFDAPEQARRDLLAGMLDSDGYVSVIQRKDRPVGRMRCQVGFTNSNRRLVEEFTSIAVSLGVKCGQICESHPTRKDWRTMYTVHPNILSMLAAGLYFQVARKQSKFNECVRLLQASETRYTPPDTSGEGRAQPS